ncbi:MAG: MBL fold metallo-hydrolase [Veillonellales bacterium]
MENSKAKITYLFHSGYAVETKQHFLIFDYYQPVTGKNPSIRNGIITTDMLRNKSHICVFVSHCHADHFDPVIWRWGKSNSSISYILSSDISIPPGQPACHSLSAYEELKVDSLSIKTFGSTDQGISFLVQADGLSIFHAGDLNWWHWKGESKEEQSYAEAIFKAEMEKLSGHSIDIAFFPVDRRLEEFYSGGAEYFAEKMQPKILFPMHFGKDLGATKAFAQKTAALPFSTVEITHKGQEFFF